MYAIRFALPLLTLLGLAAPASASSPLPFGGELAAWTAPHAAAPSGGEPNKRKKKKGGEEDEEDFAPTPDPPEVS